VVVGVVVVSLLVDTLWVRWISMEKFLVSLGLGSRPRLLSIPIEVVLVMSDGLQNTVAALCPDLPFLTPSRSHVVFYVIYFSRHHLSLGCFPVYVSRCGCSVWL